MRNSEFRRTARRNGAAILAPMLERLKAMWQALRPGDPPAPQAGAHTRPAGLAPADDTLTGLLHRPAFAKEMKARRERGERLALVLVDLDHFKLVNDTHGHDVGDKVLAETGVRLMMAAPRQACLARWGGDEFAVLVPGDPAAGRQVADALLEALRRPMHVGLPSPLHVTASAGIAPVGDKRHVDEAVQAADVALYAAKHRGRDQSLVFTEEVGGVVSARRELAAAVSLLQERNRELQQLVQTDALTGLANRHALDGLLPQRVGADDAAAGWRQCAVAFLDIDHFSDYNHLHGDAQGDQVLRRVAESVRACARRGDLVFRKGGEEIVVLLPDTAPADARHAAERMRAAVQALAIPHAGSSAAGVVTVTVGVAAASAGPALTVQQLMERAADLAMQAKVKRQRNCVHAA
jgi:diguanylate cyclase (GGDEF)-like protein